MGILDAIQGNLVYLDVNIWIYLRPFPFPLQLFQTDAHLAQRSQ